MTIISHYFIEFGSVGANYVKVVKAIDRATSVNRSKIVDFAPTRSVWPEISGRPFPANHFCMDRCPTTLPLTVFTRINFVADFLQSKCDFRGKTVVLYFAPPPFGLIAWRARSGLPISVNWTFSLGITAEALRAIIGSKSAISL